MKLITQRVHMNKCNCRDSRQITLDRDFNVPDAKPDALSIMKEQGNIQIEEVRMVDGKAGIKGELVFQLLYAVDGDMPVNEMSGSIPFEEMIPLSCADRDDELTVNATVEDWIWGRRKMSFRRKRRFPFPGWYLAKRILSGYGMNGRYRVLKRRLGRFCILPCDLAKSIPG